MIVRVFRARPKPGRAAELLDLAKQISIPFVDGHFGLLARYMGTSMSVTEDEIVMISVWENLDSLKKMTGEDWESAVIPDPRQAELIEECFVNHYETVG